jgi:hypothetical protein
LHAYGGLEHGLVPSFRFHIDDQHTLLELVAEGLGVGVSTRAGMALYPELALTALRAADARLNGVAVAAWTDRGIRNEAVHAPVRHARSWAGPTAQK